MQASPVEWMIRLYPRRCRSEFGDEMASVLRQSIDAARNEGLLPLVHTVTRETLGLLVGAASEHIQDSLGSHTWFQIATRRFNMRSEFRYPKATAPMMALILACIVWIIYKAGTIQVSSNLADYDPSSSHQMFLVIFGLALLVACLAGAAGWFILHALHQSGVHRLSEAQTWPQPK